MTSLRGDESKAIKTNNIHQAAYVVNNIDRAIDHWIRTANVGPFYVMRDCTPENVVYRGEPSEGFMCDVAFAQAGPVQIELVQVKSPGPNIYRDTVPFGKEAYHHQAYFADDLDAEVDRFAAMGVEVGTRANFGAVQYAFFDTTHLIGCMTEVLQNDAGLKALFKSIAEASIDWTGSDPVRVVS